jgi:hypothetical protein
MTYASQVRGNQPPDFTSQFGGKQTSASANEARGKKTLNSSNQAGGKQSAIASQASGNHIVEKLKKIGHKHQSSCNLCKGYHRTHICPSILEV